MQAGEDEQNVLFDCPLYMTTKLSGNLVYASLFVHDRDSIRLFLERNADRSRPNVLFCPV